jgi:hypothetical protein
MMPKGAGVTEFVFLRESLPDKRFRLSWEVEPRGLCRSAYQRPSGATSRPKVGAFIHGLKVVDFCCRGKKRHTRKVCLFDVTDFPKMF